MQAPVQVVFACILAGGDILYAVYHCPTISLANSAQRQAAALALRLPPAAYRDVRDLADHLRTAPRGMYGLPAAPSTMHAIPLPLMDAVSAPSPPSTTHPSKRPRTADAEAGAPDQTAAQHATQAIPEHDWRDAQMHGQHAYGGLSAVWNEAGSAAAAPWGGRPPPGDATVPGARDVVRSRMGGLVREERGGMADVPLCEFGSVELEWLNAVDIATPFQAVSGDPDEFWGPDSM